jgi:hypothetical protein
MKTICPNDTDGDGDCAKCANWGGCFLHHSPVPALQKQAECDELRAAIKEVENQTAATMLKMQASNSKLRAEVEEWKRRHENAVNMLHAAEEERAALFREIEALREGGNQ